MKSDGYKNINIEIISYTKNPGKIIWEMLKQTWINLHNVKYDPNSNIIKEFIEDSLYKRLNPTPQETIMIQAIFKNISRVNLAQLTRHRGWLFNSESQMPQKVNHNILIPINTVQSKYYERILKLIKDVTGIELEIGEEFNIRCSLLKVTQEGLVNVDNGYACDVFLQDFIEDIKTIKSKPKFPPNGTGYYYFNCFVEHRNT